MGKALYRKYRSKRLSEVVGQAHVTDILTRSLKEGRVSHAYLLTGPRGVGKTSIARILAHEINKLPYNEETTHLDIIEIDAASNNGVEDVRALREKVQIAPVSAEKKIYIIDEVHMLSKAAFNALLKTLEEPPEHAVFILATTDVDKLPPTIISRTQRFSFRAINVPDAVRHLRHIADSEKLKIDDEALELIATRGDGSFRDSISLLDQLRSLADKQTGITRELVEQSLGLAPTELVAKLLAAYENKDLKTIVELLDESENAGVQTSALVSQLIHAVRGVVAEKPQLLELLDLLLDVAKSSQPNIKLLTALAAHATPKPKSVALAAPVAEISAPVAELQKITIKAKPDLPESSHSRATSGKHLQPEFNPTSGLDVEPGAKPFTGSSERRGEQKAEEKSPNENSNEPLDTTKAKSVDEKAIINFDWDKLIEFTRANYVAIYSVLSKCSHELDGNTLVLYTGGAFYKKKLDDSKHRANLSQALTEIGAGNLLIETIGTPQPPKDSTAAAVAAIMGGGEEVKVDETPA